MSTKIMIEVAYATPEFQKIIELEVEKGTSVFDAAGQSEITQYFPEIDFEHINLGVFGKIVPPDYELIDGDRIEIYRALIADPKEIRRQRAAKGLKTKKGVGAG
jgi:hypothetical protein